MTIVMCGYTLIMYFNPVNAYPHTAKRILLSHFPVNYWQKKSIIYFYFASVCNFKINKILLKSLSFFQIKVNCFNKKFAGNKFGYRHK